MSNLFKPLFIIAAASFSATTALAQPQGLAQPSHNGEASYLLSTTQQTTSELPNNVAAILQTLPEDTVIGIAVLDKQGRLVFHHNSQRELPTASAIKSFLLFELFAHYGSELDRERRTDISAILKNKKHPAIAHFGQAHQQEIVDELQHISIKQLGSIMIDSTDRAGKPYSNIVYNAAANVAIALLGGPSATTVSVQQRHDAFRKVHFRRYMLARRNVTGDNTATPVALATLFQSTLNQTSKGSHPNIVREFANILLARDYPNGDKLYAKGGTLYSDPVTQVRSGQYRSGETAMNYAIMAHQKLKTKTSGKQQHEMLKKLTLAIYTGLQNPD